MWRRKQKPLADPQKKSVAENQKSGDDNDIDDTNRTMPSEASSRPFVALAKGGSLVEGRRLRTESCGARPVRARKSMLDLLEELEEDDEDGALDSFLRSGKPLRVGRERGDSALEGIATKRQGGREAATCKQRPRVLQPPASNAMAIDIIKDGMRGMMEAARRAKVLESQKKGADGAEIGFQHFDNETRLSRALTLDNPMRHLQGWSSSPSSSSSSSSAPLGNKKANPLAGDHERCSSNEKVALHNTTEV